MFLTLLPVLIFSGTPAECIHFKVEKVERVERFAGRLGLRVDQTLTLSRDGKTYILSFGRSHTAAGAVPEFKAGETIVVRGAIREGRVEASLRDVRKL